MDTGTDGGPLPPTGVHTSDAATPDIVEMGSPASEESTENRLAQRQAVSQEDAPVLVYTGGHTLPIGVFDRQQLKSLLDQGEPCVILHGLPAEFLTIIGERCPIPRDFIEAHNARRAYRTTKVWQDETWKHWIYPELVTGLSKGSSAGRPSDPSNVMGEPVVKALGYHDFGVVFCRASYWESDTELYRVLFLDRTPWKEVGSPLKKAKRGAAVTKVQPPLPAETEEFSWKVEIGEEEDIPSLEEVLIERLNSDDGIPYGIDYEVTRLAYHQWLELFDALPLPGSEFNHSENMALLWQMLEYLEQNAESQKDSWRALIDRTQRRIDAILRTPTVSVATERGINNEPQQGLEGPRGTKRPRPSTEGMYNQKQPPLDLDEINRRNLDRITYLGGILLPLTVVSGILGIEGRYGPEGHQFWVFWAAAVVSSAVCLLIIYLDQVRGLEVWFEVTANDTIEAMFPRPGDTASNTMKLSGLEPGSQGTTGSMPHVYAAENGDVAIRADEGVQVVLDSSGAGGPPTIWFHRSQSGASGKTWRKGQLGWGGAVKKTVGYYHFRGGKVRFVRPGADDD